MDNKILSDKVNKLKSELIERYLEDNNEEWAGNKKKLIKIAERTTNPEIKKNIYNSLFDIFRFSGGEE